MESSNDKLVNSVISEVIQKSIDTSRLKKPGDSSICIGDFVKFSDGTLYAVTKQGYRKLEITV